MNTVNYERLSDFGRRLEKLREKKGINRKTLVDKIHVSDKTYRSWIARDDAPIGMDTLCELCDYLDCDADYLLGRIDYLTHDTERICKLTGISENNVLKMISTYNLSPDNVRSLNFLLDSANFDNLLTHLSILEQSYYPVYGAYRYNRKPNDTAIHNMQIHELYVSDDLSNIRTEFRNRIRQAIKSS